jgi:N-acetylglucosaminyldiphosphoundecaprenol N-acetyl-beta-D-mannosaminyltransferase
MIEDVKVLGVQFSSRTLDETANYIESKLSGTKSKPFHVITANPEIVMQINRDKELEAIVNKAGIITADGVGILLGAKILGSRITERVTGVELLVALIKLCEQNNHSIYLLGADEETNLKLYEYIVRHYPKVRISGKHHGYFSLDDDKAILKDINDSNTDFLVMAMGSPRAHKWFDKRRNDLDVKVAMDVGGGFDVLSGNVKRAPNLFIKLNIEWLYRRFLDSSRAERQKDLYRYVGEIMKEKFNKSK